MPGPGNYSVDFLRSYFITNAPVRSVDRGGSRAPPEFVGLEKGRSLISAYRISADLEKNGGQKCSTGQRFIFTEVAFYKIHILA